MRDRIQGLTWDEFKDQVIVHNPVLQNDSFISRADKTYTLPENAQTAPAITWTQQLTGFSGNRWQCWINYVREQVPGIAWEDFRDQYLTYNPTLQDDGFVFKTDKTYVLPEKKSGTIYSRATLTDNSGKSIFNDLPNSGDCDLPVQCADYQSDRARLTLQADTTHNDDFFAGGYRENYLPFVQVIVQRFRDHKRVFAWELGNELKAWQRLFAVGLDGNR